MAGGTDTGGRPMWLAQLQVAGGVLGPAVLVWFGRASQVELGVGDDWSSPYTHIRDIKNNDIKKIIIIENNKRE